MPIPHLHVTRTGITQWEEVPVGEYRTVTLHSGPMRGREVLLQKNKDGSATIHLHPEHINKSFSIHEDGAFAMNPLKDKMTYVGFIPFEAGVIIKSEREKNPLPKMPTQILHSHDMYGRHHYLPLHQEELADNAYPIHNALAVGKVGTQDGFVHSLPKKERDAAHYHHEYESLGLNDRSDDDYITPHYDYRQLEDMPLDEIHRRLEGDLRRNGSVATPDGDGHMIPSPSGEWYHLPVDSIELPHGHAPVSHAAALVMNPSEIWEKDGKRIHTLHPMNEEGSHFPNGIHLHAHPSKYSGAWEVHRIDIPNEQEAQERRSGRPVYIRKRRK